MEGEELELNKILTVVFLTNELSPPKQTDMDVNPRRLRYLSEQRHLHHPKLPKLHILRQHKPRKLHQNQHASVPASQS